MLINYAGLPLFDLPGLQPACTELRPSARVGTALTADASGCATAAGAGHGMLVLHVRVVCAIAAVTLNAQLAAVRSVDGPLLVDGKACSRSLFRQFWPLRCTC